jgi:hypothetical protein
MKQILLLLTYSPRNFESLSCRLRACNLTTVDCIINVLVCAGRKMRFLLKILALLVKSDVSAVDLEKAFLLMFSHWYEFAECFISLERHVESIVCSTWLNGFRNSNNKFLLFDSYGGMLV